MTEDYEPTDRDIESEQISAMLELADDYSLTFEVVRSFHQAAAEGLSIIDACQFAISEWDLE